jgi:GrpB-like predicted nucleotidyltransferase (UPF0157 family)
MAIVIENYNSLWPASFEAIKNRIWPVITEIALGIEHIGSTSVPGMWAKPVIDIDIIIKSYVGFGDIKQRLSTLGYKHLGQLGIKDRDAFQTENPAIRHNLYVCPECSLALKNHLVLREHLKNHEVDRIAYSNLKRDLAQKFPEDIGSYVEGKTAFIVEILKAYSFMESDLKSIIAANKST